MVSKISKTDRDAIKSHIDQMLEIVKSQDVSGREGSYEFMLRRVAMAIIFEKVGVINGELSGMGNRLWDFVWRKLMVQY